MRTLRITLVALALTAVAAAGEDDVLLSGVVTGPDGKPVRRAVLEFRHPYRWSALAGERVRASRKGEFEVDRGWVDEHLPAAWAYATVIVRDPSGEHAPKELFGLSRGGRPSIELDQEVELEPAAPLTVRVVAADGDRPVAGAFVQVVDPSRSGERVHEEVATDAGGRATVEAVPERGLDLRVFADGFLPAGRPGAAPTEGELTVRLERGLTLTGRVLDAEGQPLAQAVVGLDRGDGIQSLLPNERWLEERLCWEAYVARYGEDPYAGDPDARSDFKFGRRAIVAVTDAAGRYRLAGIPPGEHTVMALHVQHQTATAAVTLAGDAERDFTVRPGGVLTGVARRYDGAPAVGAVEACSPMGPPFRVAKIGPDGRYRLEGLAPYAYTLHVSDDGTLAATRIAAGEQGVGGSTSPMATGVPGREVVCDLGGGARLEGKLAGAKGYSPMTTLLLVRGGEVEPKAYRSGAIGDGYRFDGVAPGEYVLFLFVGEEGRDEPVLGQVTVPDGVEAVRLDAAIPPEEIAREKERTQARMKALLGDDWVPPDERKAEPEPEPEADPALVAELTALLGVRVDLDPADRIDLEYDVMDPALLQGFKAKGLQGPRVLTGEPAQQYRFGVDLTSKRTGTLLHRLALKGDFSITVGVQLLTRSPRSALCLLLDEKIGLAWGQTICNPRNLRPYDRRRRPDPSRFTAEESLELVIARSGDELTVTCDGAGLDRRTLGEKELRRVRFGVAVSDARILLTRLHIVGTVDRDGL